MRDFLRCAYVHFTSFHIASLHLTLPLWFQLFVHQRKHIPIGCVQEIFTYFFEIVCEKIPDMASKVEFGGKNELWFYSFSL